MTLSALATLPSNVVALTDANEPSIGEIAFRTLYENLSKANLSHSTGLIHLKGSLRSWIRASKTPGFSPETMGAALSESDEALLNQLENALSDALTHRWPIRTLSATIKATAIRNYGIIL